MPLRRDSVRPCAHCINGGVEPFNHLVRHSLPAEDEAFPAFTEVGERHGQEVFLLLAGEFDDFVDF